MKTLKILPQKIFKFKCKPQLLESTLENLKDDEWVEHDEKWKVIQSKDTRLNKDPKYFDIHNWVRECFNKVKDELKFRCTRIEITQSWANRAKENQWQWTHSHPNSFMSAILYLTDSDASTWFSMDNFWTGNNTNLHYPSNTSNIIKVIYEEDESNLVVHKQPTVSGDLIIFPSTLIHSVDQHKTQEHDRYTMSFNSYPCGVIGSMEKSAGIILEVL